MTAVPLAAAPSATAVWRSNLGDSYTIGGTTYAIALGGGTLQQDGTIQAPSQTVYAAGSTFDLTAAKPASVSVLVKYSGFVAPTAVADYETTFPIALAGVRDSDGNLIGEIAGNIADGKIQPCYMPSSEVVKEKGTWTPVSVTGATVPASGYFLFSYSAANGDRFYAGETLDALDGFQDTTAHYSGRTVATLSIGGEAFNKNFNGSGIVIEEVALFVDQYLTNTQVAEYVFPTLTANATMKELNAMVAAGGDLYFTANPVITLDVEPSDATKAYLQGANWSGTVLIKDVDKINIDPTAYGNPNSTLKLSGVKGYFAAAQYNSSATPALELENSETEGREYGLYLNNGYSFESQGRYYWTQTPELKGSGTLKADSSGAAVLVVVDKWDSFTGKLELTNKAVYFGTGIPEQAKNVVTAGTIKINGALPATIGTWTYTTAFGTVPLTTAADGATAAFLTSSKWRGTCQLNWNHTGAFDIVNYGNANSVVEIVSPFSAYPTQNGGSAAANLAAELKLSADWTVPNGWDNKTTTFAKLSGTGSLVVNGTSSGSTGIPYTIATIEDFTGSLGGKRGKFTIGTIVSSVEPADGTKLVGLSSLSKAPVLENTAVQYNGETVTGIELEVKEDGIYAVVPTYVASITHNDATAYYKSLQEAVNAAVDGQTVKVLGNVALESTVEVASGKSVVIDLSGATVTGPADGYVFSNAGEMAIAGSGAVTGAGGIVANTASGASVAVSGGDYSVTGSLFGNVEGATIVVSGGTYNKAVDDEFLAEGYEVTEGNGTYGVREDKGWIYEDADYPGHTGTWETEVVYDETTGKAEIASSNTYTADRPSSGRMVTLDMTLSFDGDNDDDEGLEGAKAAVRLGAGASEGEYVFQLFATTNGVSGWVDVQASGVVANTNVDFSFTFVLDMTNRTYTAKVDDVPLVSGDAVFGFGDAAASDTVQSIAFTGPGTVTSIIGSYADAAAEFAEGQKIGEITLTAAQADWLNGQDAYDALSERLASMTQTALDEAYLLNLDVLDKAYSGTYEFKVDAIDVVGEKVTVTVKLVRNGALDGGINGTLKLKGGNSLPASSFTVLDGVSFGDQKFDDAQTATCTFDKAEADAAFYQPVIE